MKQRGFESLSTARAWAVDLAVCAVAGAVLGVIGPFGSFFNDGLAVRVAYWMAALLFGGLLFGVAVRWLWPRAAERGDPVWLWAPPLAVVVAAPLALGTRVLATTLWPNVPRLVGLLEWYGQSLLIGVAYLGLYLVFRRPKAAVANDSTTDAPRILDRLPPRLGRDLLCMQMEDHYVRLHTSRGSALVLMPFGQAMQHVRGTDGRQVHRSWWVARRAVKDVVRDGRNLRLRLTSGIEAPVARAKIAELRMAGWLPADL